jgi:hypothetical protein
MTIVTKVTKYLSGKSEIYIAPHSSKPSKPPIPIYQATEMSVSVVIMKLSAVTMKLSAVTTQRICRQAGTSGGAGNYGAGVQVISFTGRGKSQMSFTYPR